jgi:hypothetical protein
MNASPAQGHAIRTKLSRVTKDGPEAGIGFLSNKSAPSEVGFLHVLALELPQLSK